MSAKSGKVVIGTSILYAVPVMVTLFYAAVIVLFKALAGLKNHAAIFWGQKHRKALPTRRQEGP